MEYFGICVDGAELVASFPSKVEGECLVVESEKRLQKEMVLLGDDVVRAVEVMRSGGGAYALKLLEGLVVEFPSCFSPRFCLGELMLRCGLFHAAAVSYGEAGRCAPDKSLEYRALSSEASSWLSWGKQRGLSGDGVGAREGVGRAFGVLERASELSFVAHPVDAVLKEYAHASLYCLLAALKIDGTIDGESVVEVRGLLASVKAKCELVRQLGVVYNVVVCENRLVSMAGDVEQLEGMLE